MSQSTPRKAYLFLCCSTNRHSQLKGYKTGRSPRSSKRYSSRFDFTLPFCPSLLFSTPLYFCSALILLYSVFLYSVLLYSTFIFFTLLYSADALLTVRTLICSSLLLNSSQLYSIYFSLLFTLEFCSTLLYIFFSTPLFSTLLMLFLFYSSLFC